MNASPRPRLALRHALLAAASIALLGCASTAKTAPSEATPKDDGPTAVAADDVGPDPSWFWGEPLEVTQRGDALCYTTAKLAVLVSADSVQFDAADKAPGCAMGPDARSIEVMSERDFRGVAGDHVLVAEHLGSEIYTLSVFDSAGTEVYVADNVPPAAENSFDAAKRELIVGFGVEFPESCTAGLEDYAAQEAACWPEIQKRHPVLESTEAPGCDCGPGGLWPFPVLHKRVSLDAPSAPAVESLPLVCDCSS